LKNTDREKEKKLCREKIKKNVCLKITA